MKSALTKDILREIKKKLNQFFSIAAILTLGVGFFIGIRVTGSDMRITADDYFDTQRLMDIRVMTTLGVDQQTLDAVKALPSVQSAYSTVSLDTLAKAGKHEFAVKTFALPENGDAAAMNLPILKEGRLSLQDGECVIDDFMGELYGIRIGDTITLSPADEDSFTGTAFTVVGTLESPLYIDVQRGYTSLGDGKLDGYLYLPRSAIKLENDTEIDIAVKDAAALSAYSDEYKDKVSSCMDELKAMEDDLGTKRLEAVKAPLLQELADGQAEYDANKAKADTELSDAKVKLDAAKAELTKGKTDLYDGVNAIYEQLGRTPPDYADQPVNVTAQLLREVDAYLSAKQTALDAGYAQIAPLAAAAPTQYAQQKAVLDANAAALTAAGQQLHAATTQLKEAANTLVSGEADYQEGLQKYNDESAQAEQKLADAQKKLADGKADIAAIKSPTIYVQDRSSVMAYASYRQDSDRIEAIGRVFPLIFFIVAALVCLSTITRMVEEHRMQIGTLKALGYTPAAIALKYILFAFSASLLGMAFGMLFGYNMLPIVIYNAYRTLYSMPELIHPFQLEFLILPAILAMICTTLSAYMACKLELRSVPAKLMRPSAPPAGKRVLLERIGLIWNRLSFLQKVTMRNIFRNKARFWMSVLGIAGCTGLLLTGFGLRYSVLSMMDKQYGDISLYTSQILLEKEITPEERAAVNDVIAANAPKSKQLDAEMLTTDVTANGKSYSATMTVPASVERLSDFIVLREEQGRRQLSLTDDGAVINGKLASLLNVKVGDSITLVNTDEGINAGVRVAGITENYLLHYVYLTPACYSRVTGQSVEKTTVLLKLEDASADAKTAISSKLLEQEGVTAVVHLSEYRKTFAEMMNSFDSVIWVIILAAGALALVVVYNLSTININERIREIATIKVLGFYDRETSSYIFRENAVLTVIGIAFGCIFGIFLHRFVIGTSEIDIVHFVPDIEWSSYVLSAVLTAFFAAAVNLFMHFRLKKIDMAGALKSVE